MAVGVGWEEEKEVTSQPKDSRDGEKSKQCKSIYCWVLTSELCDHGENPAPGLSFFKYKAK